jgi:prophage DNA circulation protein
MAWKDDLLDATFRGVFFAVISARDDVERAQVQHEYPYRDGAEIEDMGRRPRKFTIRAVFWGDDYADYLADLVDTLDTPGPGELIHPVFGSITVSVFSYEIDHHEDHPDYAEIEMVMIEAEQDQPFFAATYTTMGQADAQAYDLADAVADAQAWALEAYASWADGIPGLSDVLAVAEAVSGVTDALAMARDLVGLPLAILDNVLGAPLALLSDATAVAGTVLDTALSLPDAVGVFLPFAQFCEDLVALPLTMAGEALTFVASVERYAGILLGGPASDAPGPQPVLTLAATVTPTSRQAVDLATVASQGFAQGAIITNLARTAVVAKEASRVLTAEVSAPTLTPSEVEAVVGSTRERIQATIDDAVTVLPTYRAHPVAEALRTAALAVQELGRTVIHLHPPLISTAVPSACNLHWLAHKLYGDYSRADELARLNPGIRNPNFLARGQTILRYAK